MGRSGLDEDDPLLADPSLVVLIAERDSILEEQLRRVSHELHPRILDDLGLVESVRFLSTGFGRRTAISVDVDVSNAAPCPRAVETVCYRLVQEALSNVGKHARATHVTVYFQNRDGYTVLAVEDNGIGFATAEIDGRRDSGGHSQRIEQTW